MKTLLKRLAAMALAAGFALSVQTAAVAAQEDCEVLTPEVSFCYGATHMTPFDAGDERDWYLSSDESMVMWFYINQGVSAGISNEALLEAVIKSDAQAMGAPNNYVQIVVPFREVNFGGHKGLETYYFVPGGTQEGEPNDRIMGRAILRTPNALIVVNTSAYGEYVSPSNVLVALNVREAFRITPQGGGAQTNTEQVQLGNTPPDCDDLGAGVWLCGIRALSLEYYKVAENGTLHLGLGDTTAEISVGKLDASGPPISEVDRWGAQLGMHASIVKEWLKARGTAPSDAGVGLMLRLPTGNGPAEESRHAYAETYFIDDGDGVNTHDVSFFYGQKFFVVALLKSPGSTASEDNLFLLEEIYRGLELP